MLKKTFALYSFFLLLFIISIYFFVDSFFPSKSSLIEERVFLDTDTTSARELFAIGVKLTDQSRYDSSLAYFEKASAIYQKDRSWEHYVDCMNFLADNYRRIGKYDTAYTLLTATIDLSIQRLGVQHASTAMAINKLGLWYRDAGEYDKALEYFQRALAIRLKVLPQDHMDIGWSYNNIGMAQYDRGNFNATLNNYEKVIPIFKKSLGTQSGPLALLYNNIAITYDMKGNQDKALEYHKMAMEIRIQLFGSDHITLAQTYGNIGNVYLKKGEYDKAFQFYNKSLSIRTNKLGLYHPETGSTYYNLGFAYKETKQLDEALRNFRQALDIYEKIFGGNHPMIARSCDEIGVQMLEKNQPDSALLYFNRALAIWSRQAGVKNFRRAYEFSHIGDAYMKMGRTESALKYYNQALAIYRTYYGEKHEDVAQAYTNIANAYLSAGDLHRALEFIERAINALTLNTAANITESRTVSSLKLLLVLESKGDILQKIYSKDPKTKGTLQNAFIAYESAIQILDKIRREYFSDESKLLIGQKINGVIEKGIGTAFELFKMTGDNSYMEKAFVFSEKNKSAVLSAALKNEQAKLYTGVPDSLLEYEMQLRAQMGYYTKKLFTEQNTGGYGNKKYRSFQDRIFELTNDYEKHLMRIERDYPKYYDLKYRSDTISYRLLQQNLADSFALIHYFIGDQTVSVFCITKQKIEWKKFDKDPDMSMLIQNMRTGIESQHFNLYVQTAEKLFDILFKTLNLSQVKQLVIIPDGLLATVPFEALLTEPADKIQNYNQLPYLIRRFSISYAYSASLWYSNYYAASGKAKNNLIGFAPSIFK